ncbi:MAG TPA: HAD family hydrolase [Phycisphaerae bacterium]|nr:HAD family hydrolase [Phycisphaerae bacterium]
MAGAVIFDLDGTLTVPVLDFDGMRAEMGLTNEPILEAMERMDAGRRADAEAILRRHEHRAAHNSVLQEGAAETLAALARRGWHTAILTRNARRWTQVVLDKHNLTVDTMRCRDDGAVKPSAAPIVDLCQELECQPSASWMVGDHLFDIRSGRQAGCTTVLLLHADRPTPEYADQADHVINRLTELLDLLDKAPVNQRP